MDSNTRVDEAVELHAEAARVRQQIKNLEQRLEAIEVRVRRTLVGLTAEQRDEYYLRALRSR